MEETIWSPHTPALEIVALPDILAHHPVVVLHFWAIWNEHNHQFESILQAVRPEYARDIAFYAVDTDAPDNRELCTRCNVLNLPALSCFVDGTWRETWIGVRTAVDLRTKLNAWLAPLATESKSDNIV